MQQRVRHGRPLGNLAPGLKGLLVVVLVLLGLRYALATQQFFGAYLQPHAAAAQPASQIPTHAGKPMRNRLEAALLGTMSNNAPGKERQVIIDWSVNGADEALFESKIRPIVDKRCMRCHAVSQWGAPLFGSYDNFAEFAAPFPPVTEPVAPPIHLFGMAFLFGVMGLVFRQVPMPSAWLRRGLIVLPFPVLLADAAAVYLTAPKADITGIITLSGAVLALVFAVQWALSMVQLLGGRA